MKTDSFSSAHISHLFGAIAKTTRSIPGAITLLQQDHRFCALIAFTNGKLRRSPDYLDAGNFGKIARSLCTLGFGYEEFYEHVINNRVRITAETTTGTTGVTLGPLRDIMTSFAKMNFRSEDLFDSVARRVLRGDPHRRLSSLGDKQSEAVRNHVGDG